MSPRGSLSPSRNAAMKLEFLICPNCSRSFGLATGTGKPASTALPDPFPAQCPHCEKVARFEKKDIKTLSGGESPERQ
jgi:hypothetical protein